MTPVILMTVMTSMTPMTLAILHVKSHNQEPRVIAES